MSNNEHCIGYWCARSPDLVFKNGINHAIHCTGVHDGKPLIPMFRPLKVPEPVEVDEVEIFTTFTEPPWNICWYTDASTWMGGSDAEIYVENGESATSDNLVERINDIARASAIHRAKKEQA